VYNDKVGEARHSKQDSGRVDAGVSSVRALDCGIANAVDWGLPTEPLIHNNRGVVGLKVSYVDHQAQSSLRQSCRFPPPLPPPYFSFSPFLALRN